VQEQLLFSVPRQVFRASALFLGSAAAVFLLAGCGNNYRPVVSAINPVGPSSQPTVYATALSDPGGGKNGLITVVDVFGETNIANASVAPSPSYLGVDPLGEAYVLHSNSVLVDSFTSASGLMTNTVRQSSLAAGAAPTQINAGSGSGAIYITEPGVSQVSVLTGGAPPTARQDLPVPANPVYTVGLSGSQRVYTLSQGATPGTTVGTATAIENGTNNVISASIPVGISPVYGIMTADSRRAFVINNKGNGTGTGTVTVINVQGNVLDRTVNVGVNPVWADLAPAVNEIAVLNAGTGATPGSLSIINVALCSQIALSGNTACDATNPTDAVNFGTVLGTVPVGVGPVQVAVLQDLSKAYVANATDGTITVVDMNSMVATKTITLPKQADAQGNLTVPSTLNWIGAVVGDPTGKVLVTATNSQSLYIIRTDTDVLSATVPLQGYGVSVRIAQ
jgi:DNA-binding beta-propeller fold protein YncE